MGKTKDDMVLLSYDTKPNGQDEEAHLWLVTGKVGTPEMDLDDRYDVAWFVLVGTHGNAGKFLMAFEPPHMVGGFNALFINRETGKLCYDRSESGEYVHECAFPVEEMDEVFNQMALIVYNQRTMFSATVSKLRSHIKMDIEVPEAFLRAMEGAMEMSMDNESIIDDIMGQEQNPVNPTFDVFGDKTLDTD